MVFEILSEEINSSNGLEFYILIVSAGHSGRNRYVLMPEMER